MTANHAHTPTTEQIKRLFVAVYPYPNPDEAFERWLADRDSEVETAAEQRGAVKALRDAADIKLGNGYYEMLVEDELNTRADLLEGDDD